MREKSFIFQVLYYCTTAKLPTLPMLPSPLLSSSPPLLELSSLPSQLVVVVTVACHCWHSSSSVSSPSLLLPPSLLSPLSLPSLLSSLSPHHSGCHCCRRCGSRHHR